MLRIDREKDARAVADALSGVYPAYEFRPVKPPRARRWRLAIHCRVSGAFLKWAEL